MSTHIDRYPQDDHPVFRRAPLLGWHVTTDEAEPLFVPVVFWRDGRPVDWQGGRILVADQVPGSSRVLVQDMGAGPLTLTTNLLFQDAAIFHRFRRYTDRTGTLTMNGVWTIHEPDRTEHWGGVDYAHFDAVPVMSLGAQTFDMARRPMLEGVVFQREDGTW
jgi:hypothetical protein